MAAEAEYPGSQNQGQELECQISDGRLWLNGIRTAALSLRDLGGVNIASYMAALSCLLSPGAGTLKLCMINVCGWAALCGRGCPTGCRMFRSIPGLCLSLPVAHTAPGCHSQTRLQALPDIRGGRGGQHGLLLRSVDSEPPLFSGFITLFWIFDVVRTVTPVDWNRVAIPWTFVKCEIIGKTSIFS